ncbi:PREDICTED: centrosomal protein of 120 kDa-like [Papilio xuthus]|uniref:Centrosomal protein of 120 kDa-like n=1 Tax=Papilio xuthus TaxID=66420 RepID=A0AAJ6ZDF0_PAPXU|nr:PREDICTED: centrosomal protein of 120 kDa-like [Papilio xuthus]
MDELRGPNIQIVLHVKEGIGFGFLRIPFIVSGSLNGYMLETDPVVPTHAPAFDAELVWEADKRRFRSLRVQNVPIKVEVFTTSTQGRKDKIGYILLSLLGAQPCPSNKFVDVKYSWHKLLGIKSEGKCCHPQLLMSLSIEDRVSTPTPRNELRMFHSNEVAYPLSHTPNSAQAGGPVLLTLNEYLNESKKVVSSPDLQPQLLCEEGLIQIGLGDQLYVLSFVIGSVENLDMLLPNDINKEAIDCCITYSIFTHNIMTDRVGVTSLSTGSSAQFNQRTSLRLRTHLAALARYFAECPHLVVRVCVVDRGVGICSLDLRKLIPTEDVKRFISEFCNSEGRLAIHERCYLVRCDDTALSVRRPYMDVEISLKYIADKSKVQKPNILSARSITHLERGGIKADYNESKLDYRSGSCTQIDPDVGGVGYTNKSAGNTARYKTANGDNILQTSEITELLRKMCDSLAQSQHKSEQRPFTSDMQVQCGPETDIQDNIKTDRDGDNKIYEQDNGNHKQYDCEDAREKEYKNHSEKDVVKQVLPAVEREAILQKFIDELEDWKERQQELYKCQLRRKEEYHLELLSREWEKRREELEEKLRAGVERCRSLAADLSRATEDFRLRGYRNTERERKLLEAKKALEAHYTAKYQELREASQKMEDDMHHQLKLKDMRIEELELKVQTLEKNIEVLKNNMRNMEKDAESKHSGLTKDQTASLIQELRCLEEKLDSAVQSKAFFKEQWGRAVRELHLTKMSSRRNMLSQLRREKSRLNQVGLDTIDDYEINREDANETDIKKLKDDFYADLLANTPPLESHSAISLPGPDGLDMFMEMKNASKNSINDKLNELISQRDQLIQQDNPDEATLKQLNNEIRSILINCGT